MYLDPLESKRQKIDMMTKWTDVFNKARGTDWNPIKAAEFMGTPFGAHKIKVTPASTRGMYFTWGKGYSGVYPFQGITFLTERKMLTMQETAKIPDNLRTD